MAEKEILKTEVKDRVLTILPAASACADRLASHIVDELGVREVSQLNLIRETDLTGFISVIDSRTLVKAWEEKPVETVQVRRPFANIQPHQNIRRIEREWDFDINWNDLYNGDENMKKRLQRGKKLKRLQRLELVSRTVKQVKQRVPNAKRDIFRQIMRDMKTKYPISFHSELAQGKLAPHSICKKMQDKFDNDKRPKRSTNMEHEAPAIKAAYGCRKWRIAKENETQANLESKQEELATYYEETNPGAWNLQYIDDGMDMTYGKQRNDINKQAIQIEKGKKTFNKKKGTEANEQQQQDADDFVLTLTDQLRDKWPFLFLPRGMLQHFLRLTEVDLMKQLMEFMETHSAKFIKFMSKTNQGKPIRVKKRMKEARQSLPPHHAELIALIKLLLMRFEEEEDSIWILIDRAAKEENVPNLCKIPNTPRLVVAGESIFKHETIFFTMDGTVLGTAGNIMEGIGQLFASYFVFNLVYDAHAQITLECFQRCVMEMNPPRGHKRPDKQAGGKHSTSKVHPKIKTFNTKYEEFYAERDSSTE